MNFQIIWFCQISWNSFLPFEFLFISDNFNEHCAWRLTCILVHLKWCIMYVYIFISHLCARSVYVKLICITVAKPWGGCVEHQISILSIMTVGLLVVDQVWWIKWQQDIILNYWGKQRQCDVSNKWSRTASHTTLYDIFILLYYSSLYCLMIQNLNIHASGNVIVCQPVNG